MNMVHDQQVHFKSHVFLFCIFISYPEPPTGTSGVGSFPVHSGGSVWEAVGPRVSAPLGMLVPMGHCETSAQGSHCCVTLIPLAGLVTPEDTLGDHPYSLQGVINIAVCIVQLLLQLGSHDFMLLSVGHPSVCQHTVCLSDVHISAVYQVFLGPLPQGVLTITLQEVLLYSAIGNIYSTCFFFVVFLIFSPVAANHYYSTCDSCVLQGITHHYDCNESFHCYGISSIGSAWCGSATTVYPKGYN